MMRGDARGPVSPSLLAALTLSRREKASAQNKSVQKATHTLRHEGSASSLKASDRAERLRKRASGARDDRIQDHDVFADGP